MLVFGVCMFNKCVYVFYSVCNIKQVVQVKKDLKYFYNFHGLVVCLKLCETL